MANPVHHAKIFLHLNGFDHKVCPNQSGANSSIEKTDHCSSDRKSKVHEWRMKQATFQLMKHGRCGVKEGPLFYSVQNRWTKKSFKWKLINLNLPSFGVTKTRELIRAAFNDWAKYAPLTFQEVSQNQKADFELAFIHRFHDDIRRFDGPGGTLAYAYFPPSGLIRFEAEEPWTDKYHRKGFNLRLVATHEIGHALGLAHSYDRSSIMFEHYQLMQPKDLLPKDDRDGIQALYGRRFIPRRTHPTTTRRTTKKILTTRRTTKRILTTRRTTTTTKFLRKEVIRKITTTVRTTTTRKLSTTTRKTTKRAETSTRTTPKAVTKIPMKPTTLTTKLMKISTISTRGTQATKVTGRLIPARTETTRASGKWPVTKPTTTAASRIPFTTRATSKLPVTKPTTTAASRIPFTTRATSKLPVTKPTTTTASRIASTTRATSKITSAATIGTARTTIRVVPTPSRISTLVSTILSRASTTNRMTTSSKATMNTISTRKLMPTAITRLMTNISSRLTTKVSGNRISTIATPPKIASATTGAVKIGSTISTKAALGTSKITTKKIAKLSTTTLARSIVSTTLRTTKIAESKRTMSTSTKTISITMKRIVPTYKTATTG